MEGATIGDLIVLLSSTIPLVLFVLLSLKERFRGANALLVLVGLALILLVSLLRVSPLLVETPFLFRMKEQIAQLGVDEQIASQMTEAVLAGFLGPLLLLTGLYREVRQRRRAEQEASQGAHLQEAILEAFPHAVFLVDGEGQTLFANAAARRLFGASVPNGLGEVGDKVRPVKGTSQVRDLLRFKDDIGLSPEDLRSFGDRLLSVSKKSLPSQAGTAGAVHWVQDLTAMARFTSLTREFVANLSHDFRTPLTSIRGYVDLLLEGDLGEIPAEQRQALVVIEQHTRAMEQLVGDYLDLSRLEAGAVPLREEPFDLRLAVDDALLTVRPAFDTKGVSLVVRLPSAPAMVRGDHQRMVQVLCNLLNNAEKYTPRGGTVMVTLSASPKWAQVDVTDTGPGIPEGEQPHVFSRFFRGAAASQSQTPGSGLGLTIAKSIVELHDGEMWLKSEPGRGSTFSFTVPRAAEVPVGAS